MSGQATRSGVFDPGLQPERTALAWRRAGLTFAGASLLLARVAAETSVPLALVAGGAGVVFAIAVLVRAERRYRSHHLRLTAASGATIPLTGGGLPALVALATGLLGAAAAVAVTLSALLK